MNQCQKCGTFNDENESFCTSCGASLGISMSDSNSFNPQASNSLPVIAKNNGMAIASLVLGIAGIPFICCCYSGTIMGILAVVFGFISRNKIRASGGTEKGDGMALAGIITGFVAVGLSILLIVLSLTNVLSSNEFWNEFQKQLQQNMNKNR